MADQDKDSKNLPASQRRLEKARQEGQVPRSRDLTHAAAIAAILLGFHTLGPSLGAGMIQVMRDGMTWSRPQVSDPSWMLRRFGDLGAEGFQTVWPMMALVSTVLVVSAMLPGGILLTGKPLSPKFSRLDPMSGFGRIFSKDSLVNLLKLMSVSALLAIVSWLLLRNGFAKFAHLGELAFVAAVTSGLGHLLNFLAALMGVLIFIALIDVPWQIYSNASKLRMSHQDMRDENKESEGDPMVRARIRQRQREMGRARMLSAVPAADAVITNPTHYAVAIRYDEASMGAPRVVAKGADHMAATIRAIASNHGVTLVELPPLARALYAHVKVDQEVPAALYTAVAQVLAYVYQLRQFVPGRSARKPQAPVQIQVPPELDPLTPTGARR